MTTSFRIEHDSMGELKVPADALWGAQTQRAVDNFPKSGLVMPRAFIAALGLVKQAAARANARLQLLDPKLAQAVDLAAAEVAAGKHDAQFPIDVFQTGSGTSSNMNANEVIAALASRRAGSPVHPNDHVNMGQSSNDSIPTAIHVSAALMVRRELVPALTHLCEVLQAKEREVGGIVKTGRTHLMDAMPVTLAQEPVSYTHLASRIAARSTTHGTPVKSCRITRAGVKAISYDGVAAGSHSSSASISARVTFTSSSERSRFSSRIFSE